MTNPFESIEVRLSNIESLVLDLKHQSASKEANKSKENLLTVQEAAKFLSLSVPTIYSKCSKGELPLMKRGKRLYFSDVELVEYLKEGRRQTSSEIENEAHTYIGKGK